MREGRAESEGLNLRLIKILGLEEEKMVKNRELRKCNSFRVITIE